MKSFPREDPFKAEENPWKTGTAAPTEVALAPARLGRLMTLPAPDAREATLFRSRRPGRSPLVHTTGIQGDQLARGCLKQKVLLDTRQPLLQSARRCFVLHSAKEASLLLRQISGGEVRASQAQAASHSHRSKPARPPCSLSCFSCATILPERAFPTEASSDCLLLLSLPCLPCVLCHGLVLSYPFSLHLSSSICPFSSSSSQ